jgi:hypothetical protein
MIYMLMLANSFYVFVVKLSSIYMGNMRVHTSVNERLFYSQMTMKRVGGHCAFPTTSPRCHT